MGWDWMGWDARYDATVKYANKQGSNASVPVPAQPVGSHHRSHECGLSLCASSILRRIEYWRQNMLPEGSSEMRIIAHIRTHDTRFKVWGANHYTMGA